MASKKIKKKTWPEMFEQVLNGNKMFDLRLADFKVKKGDVLVLQEWDPITKLYTGREIEKKIKYVLRTKDLKFWKNNEINKYGYVVMGIEDDKNN